MAARCKEQLARATAPGKGSGWEKLLAACTLQTVRASAMSMTKRDTLYSGFTERVRRALPREWKDPKEPYSFSYPVETRIPARGSLHERRKVPGGRSAVVVVPAVPPVIPARRRPRVSIRSRPNSQVPSVIDTGVRSTVAFISRALEYGKWINATANTSDIADTIHVSRKQ